VGLEISDYLYVQNAEMDIFKPEPQNIHRVNLKNLPSDNIETQ